MFFVHDLWPLERTYSLRPPEELVLLSPHNRASHHFSSIASNYDLIARVGRVSPNSKGARSKRCNIMLARREPFVRLVWGPRPEKPLSRTALLHLICESRFFKLFFLYVWQWAAHWTDDVIVIALYNHYIVKTPKSICLQYYRIKPLRLEYVFLIDLQLDGLRRNPGIFQIRNISRCCHARYSPLFKWPCYG